jgi:hypothetical protein
MQDAPSAPKKGGTMAPPRQLSRSATEALRRIRLIRKYPAPQSDKAEQRVLANLSVSDYLAVIETLESDTTSVPRG